MNSKSNYTILFYMKKTCRLCNKSKPEEDFFWRDKERTKRGSYCRPCQVTKNREYYARRGCNKARNEANKRSRQKMLDHIRSTKSEKPCLDCGVIYPYYVMEFDHVRGEKKYNIANMANRCGIDAINAEIAKCELVCANCHRERTFSRI